MENPVEQCGRGVSEDQKGQDEEVFWTSGQGQHKSCKLHRCASLRKMRRNRIVMASQKAVTYRSRTQALFLWHLYLCLWRYCLPPCTVVSLHVMLYYVINSWSIEVKQKQNSVSYHSNKFKGYTVGVFLLNFKILKLLRVSYCNINFFVCWKVCVCTSGCAVVLLPQNQWPEWKSQ